VTAARAGARRGSWRGWPPRLALALLCGCAAADSRPLAQETRLSPGSSLSEQRLSAGLSWSLHVDDTGLTLSVGDTVVLLPQFHTRDGLAFAVDNSVPPRYVFGGRGQPRVVWQGRVLVVDDIAYPLDAPGTWSFEEPGPGRWLAGSAGD